jgi:hypothetical protein
MNSAPDVEFKDVLVGEARQTNSLRHGIALGLIVISLPVTLMWITLMFFLLLRVCGIL